MKHSRILWMTTCAVLAAAAAFAQNAIPPAPPAAPASVPAANTAPAGSDATADAAATSAKAEDLTSGILPAAADVPSDSQLPKSFQPSYGDMTTSVLFPAPDAQAMRSVLDRVERILAVGGTPQPLNIEQRNDAAPVAAAPEAPVAVPTLMFPTFYVASIVYHAPGDWMLWINGQRVTPKRHLDGITVASVRAQEVQLIWTPDNWDYRTEVWSGKAQLSPQMQKLSAKQGSTGTNRENRTLYATMRPNQTWVTAVPMLVEGAHSAFAVTIQPQTQAASTDDQAGGVGASKSSFSSKIAQDYINKIAQEESDKVAQNSAQQAQKKPAPTTATTPAQAANSAQNAPAVEQTVPAPAAPSVPVAAAPPPSIPAPPEAVVAPQTLNDILNAVKEQKPNP